jgi:hypothetical protein
MGGKLDSGLWSGGVERTGGDTGARGKSRGKVFRSRRGIFLVLYLQSSVHCHHAVRSGHHSPVSLDRCQPGKESSEWQICVSGVWSVHHGGASI